MARQPYIVTADWMSAINGQPHAVRTRCEVTGSIGVVDVHVIPEGDFNLWGRFDILRMADRITGAPRGWSLADRAGEHHRVDTLSEACHVAAGWVLDDARDHQRAVRKRAAIYSPNLVGDV